MILLFTLAILPYHPIINLRNMIKEESPKALS